jgi:hypothetical protein
MMKSIQTILLFIGAVLLNAGCSTGDQAESNESKPVASSSQYGEVEVPEPAFQKLAAADLTETELTEAHTVLTVDAQLEGARGTFVVDTTASHHVVTREFAESHDIIFTEPTERVEGRSARGSAPTAAVETTTLRLGGDRIEADDVLAKPRASVFPDLPQVAAVGELSGVLSPQNLYDAKTRYTALNLAENTLVSVEARPTGLEAWLQMKFGGREFQDLERFDGMSPEVPHVESAINGGETEYKVLLDTSTDDSVFKATAIGVADRTMRCMKEANGECQLRGVVADGQTLALGQEESPEFTAVGTTSTLEDPGIDGVLGLDAMQHYVWVFPADDDKPIKIARAE